jgi:hypothetical protein
MNMKKDAFLRCLVDLGTCYSTLSTSVAVLAVLLFLPAINVFKVPINEGPVRINATHLCARRESRVLQKYGK